MAYASGSSDAPPVALAVWSTVCDPCSCMNISCRVLSLSAFSRGTLEENTFTMIGAGPTWSDRDRARWQLVEDPGLVELSRTGVQQAASADEPSRLPEGVAQPASSLRVQNVSAPRVCERGTRCAERDLRRDLPASCRRHALLCSAMHEDGTNGTPRVPHECRNHAEAVILVCWSISYTQLVVCYTFIGHAGGTTSTSPIQSFAGGPVSDLRARIFGTTQLALDRTRHTTSYVIKNAVISREKTLTRASAACERHAERPAWICARVSRSVLEGAWPIYPT